jgi:hypothetical protein
VAEHRITHGVGQLVTAGRNHLRDEKWVAAGSSMQLDRVDAIRRECGHSLDAQRREAQPRDGGKRRQPGDDRAQRRQIDLFVAIRGDHDGARRLDTATEQPEHVERRLVGPVDVLENKQRGPRTQPAEHLGERLSLPPAFEHLRDRIEQTVTLLPGPRAGWRARTG